jgi:organic hydroperoxide reductase OsmC/OhrA
MSEHITDLEWTLESGTFANKDYSRDHAIRFKNGVALTVSAAVGYGGNPNAIDPEEVLVAAISSCHMLTFLAVAAVKGYTVQRYTDRAVGVLEKNAEGRISVTKATLYPVIEFAAERVPNPAELQDLHARAHRGCFVANSVRTEITIVSPAPA